MRKTTPNGLKGEKMVSHTPIVSYCISLSNFFNVGKHLCLLPEILYIIFGTWQTVLPIFPLLMCGSDRKWCNNDFVFNIYNYFQVFWRFGSQFTKENELMISFIVIMLVHCLCFIPTLVGHLMWKIANKFNTFLFMVIIFNHEIVLSIANCWVPSQMATVIQLMVKDAQNRTVLNYVQVSFYFILLVFHIAFGALFVDSDSIYMKGRSSCWDGKSKMISIICIDLGMFVTRLVETLPKYYSLVFVIITVFVYTFYISFIIIKQIYVVVETNVVVASLLIGFFVGFILQNISLYVSQLDIMIIFLVVFLSSLLSYFFLDRFFKERISLALAILDQIENDESAFSILVLSPQSFIRIIRIGFQNGHLYVFTWNPFIIAAGKWPNAKEIIIQYIKFAVIYYDEDAKLESILTSLKVFRDFTSSQLRREIKLIRESRDIHLTRALKTKLKTVDDRVKMTNNLIVSFWNAIEDNNPNSTFDISLKLSKMVSHVHSDYIHYSKLSPNNWVIPSSYSHFLLDVVCDPEEGQYWTKRAHFLRGKKTMLYDASQSFGFDTFPLIPRSLSSSPQSEPPETFMTNQSTSTNSSTGSLGEFDKASNDAAKMNSVEDIDITPSGILKMGQRARIQFALWPLVVTILFFIVAFIFVPFTPGALFNVTSTKLRHIFSVFIGVSDVSYDITTIAYYLMEKALQNEKVIPSNYYISNSILNDTIFDSSIKLSEEIERMYDNIHKIQDNIATLIEQNQRSWNFIQTFSFPVLIQSGKGTKNFTSTFLETLNIMGGAAYKYSDEIGKSSYIDSEWFVFFTENFDRIPFCLEDLAHQLAKDFGETYDDLIDTVEMCFYIYGAIEAVTLPLFIFLAYGMRRHWKSIVSVFNSISRVAIHKAIQEHSNEIISKDADHHSSNRKEFRYLSTFAQMVVSRDTTSGIPVLTIICFSLFNFIVSITSCFIFDQILRSFQKQINGIPMTYYFNQDVGALFFYISELILRVIAVKSKSPYHRDTIQSLNTTMNDVLGLVSSAASKIMTVTWNEIQVGFVLTNKKIVNLYLGPKGDWISQKNEYTRMQKMPAMYQINCLQTLLIDLNFDVFNQKASTFKLSEDLWTSLKTVSDHLHPEVMEEILLDQRKFINEILNEIDTYLIIISVLMLLIGFFTISLVLYNIFQVRKGIRFSLAALSMIDHQVIQDMPSIMNLFSGKVKNSQESNRTLVSTYDTVEASIKESAVQLDSNLNIISLNNDFIETYQISDKSIYSGTSISSLVTFADPEIITKLQLHVSNEIKDNVIDFDTEMKIRTLPEPISVSFSSSRFSKKDSARLILFFSKKNFKDQKIQATKEMIDVMKDVKNYVIPEKIRNRINININKVKFMPRNTVLVAIDLLNFTDFCWKNSPRDSQLFFRNWSKFVHEQCNIPESDAVVLKTIGTTFIICLNLDLQISNYYSSVYSAIQIVRNISDFATQNHYEARYSMALAPKAVLKLSSNELFRLDLYTNKIRLLLKLISKSTNGVLIFGPKTLDILPEDVKIKTESLKIIGDNKKPAIVKSYDLLKHH